MEGSDRSRLSWSLAVGRDAAGQRAFDEVVDLVGDLLHQHYPPSCGYEAHTTRLGGPLDGMLWRITRGPFSAELGVQRFVRAGSRRDERPTMEIRLVASAGQRDPTAMNTEGREGRVVGWAVAGCGLGTVSLAAVMLGGGALPAWGQLALLIPAVAAWRATMVGLVRRGTSPPRALPGSSAPALPSPRVVRGLERWELMVPPLRAQYDLLLSRRGLPPFRAEGHLETTSATAHGRVRQVLAACSSSFTWARPALVAATEASDHAVAPPGRTTRRPPR
ncbi:MAG: hypothetical protein K0V04_22935 [Deltaproteobacteria bacterium]|nr:hypothetical protein [Deltaproteobacteria bacterium]